MRTTNNYLGKIFLGIFIMYTVLMAFFLDTVLGWIRAAPTLQGLLIYYTIGHPEFLLLIYAAFALNRSGSQIRALIGGIMTVIVVDIVNFPRMAYDTVVVNGRIALVDAGILSNSDPLILNWIMDKGLSFHGAYWVYYIVIPIIMMFAILFLLGFDGFAKRISQ